MRLSGFFILIAVAGAVVTAAIGLDDSGPDAAAPPLHEPVAKASPPIPDWATAPSQQPAAVSETLGQMQASAGDGTAPVVSTDQTAPATPELPAGPSSWVRDVEVARGHTLIGLLNDNDVPAADAARIVDALRPVYDPNRLKIGQKFTLQFASDGKTERFTGLVFAPDRLRTITLEATEDGSYAANELSRPVVVAETGARAIIRSSLFEAGNDADVPASILLALLRIFSYDVDFQRDIHPGDEFEALYETQKTEDGEVLRTGTLHYAALVLKGVHQRVYRYQGSGGRWDYFNRKGESVRKALLRTPIDGARISSRYGMRRHPILGYSKMHRGVDFAAPTGTPIYAAGSGIVTLAGRRGSYGNYIQIRHNAEISTAYAHLSRLARHIKRGRPVEQGDVIGYVGSTGRSTGPHLHYEVLRRGSQINPLSHDLPVGEKLAGRTLEAFRKHVDEVDRRFATAIKDLQIAQVGAAR